MLCSQTNLNQQCGYHNKTYAYGAEWSGLRYHWIEWDMWDKRTRRYAILEKKIIFEKDKKNGIISVIEADKPMLESLQKDILKWN